MLSTNHLHCLCSALLCTLAYMHCTQTQTLLPALNTHHTTLHHSVSHLLVIAPSLPSSAPLLSLPFTMSSTYAYDNDSQRVVSASPSVDLHNEKLHNQQNALPSTLSGHQQYSGHQQVGATHELSASIREATATMVKAMGAPRTTIGIASALGLFAFAVPNFVNAMYQLQLLHVLGSDNLTLYVGKFGSLAAVLLAFVGQFLAGLWNLTKGDTFGSVAMGAYGLFWLMYFYFIYSFEANLTALSILATGSQNPAVYTTVQGPINQGLNELFGYMCIPWLVLTFIFILCAARMALLEFWIFINVEFIFICVIGSQFSLQGSDAYFKWNKAAGAWSLMLFITALYFIAVILINTTYNAPIVPMGHSHPLIMNWPHEYGSVMHQDTHRKLNLYLPEKKLRRGATSDHGQMNYNAENEMHRTQNIAGHPAPQMDKQV